MSNDEINGLAQNPHSDSASVRDNISEGERKARNMRRAEIKVRELLKLVQHDYIDNERKSKATLDVQINNHLLPFFGERSAERLRPSDFEEYKTHRRNEGARQATINLELAAIRRAFNLGNEREIIVNRPKIKLYNIGKTNRRRGFFEQEDFDKLVAVLLPYAKQVLRFGYECGWRQSEIFDLQWEDTGKGSGYYDEAGQVIRLYDSKNGDGRVLPLRSADGKLNNAGQVIEEQKQHRVKDCPYIFHFNGRRIHRSTFNKHWHSACEASGVQRHFHDLRRTVVRNLTRAGVHRTIAKAITGHETDDIFERYDIVDERDITEAVSKMSSYLKTRNNGENDSGNTTNGQSSPGVPTPSLVSPVKNSAEMTEREGFEPSKGSSPLHDFQSSRLSNAIKSFLNLLKW